MAKEYRIPLVRMHTLAFHMSLYSGKRLALCKATMNGMYL